MCVIDMSLVFIYWLLEAYVWSGSYRLTIVSRNSKSSFLFDYWHRFSMLSGVILTCFSSSVLSSSSCSSLFASYMLSLSSWVSSQVPLKEYPFSSGRKILKVYFVTLACIYHYFAFANYAWFTVLEFLNVKIWFVLNSVII